MTRKRRNIICDDWSVRSHVLPTRRILNLDIDLTDTMTDVIAPFKQCDYSDAVVRPCITYDATDDRDIDGIINDICKQISNTAYHVHPPSRHVVGGAVVDEQDKLEINDDYVSIASEYIDKYMGDIKNKDVIIDEMRRICSELDFRGIDRLQLRPIVFDRICVENFMSFGDRHEINIGTGCFIVGGKNRSGKSALLDAISYGLYGRTDRGIRSNRLYVHNGSDSANIELDFTGGSVTRRMGRDARLSFNCIDKRAQVSIDEFLGCTYDDFRDIVYVSQGDLGGIVAKSSAEIKHAMYRWFGIDTWEQIHDIVRKKCIDYEREISNIEHVLNELAKDDVDYDGLLLKKHDTELEIEQIEHIDFNPVELRNLERIVELRGEDFANLEKMNDEMIRLDGIKCDFIRERDDIANNRNKINAMKFDGLCVIDDKPCPRADVICESISASDVDDNRVCELSKQIVQTKQKINVLMGRHTQLSHLKMEYERLMDNCVCTDIDRTIEDMRNIQHRSGDVGATRKRLVYELARVDADIDACRKRIEKIELNTKKIEIIKSKLMVYSRLRTMTSKNGIPYIQLKFELGSLKKSINTILDQMGMSFRVNIDFGAELERFSDMCKKCGDVYRRGSQARRCPSCGASRERQTNHDIVFSVNENGVKHSYAHDSGGGRALIAIAVRIAMARYFGAKVLFFDEVCGSLDDENISRLIPVLTNIREYGIEQLFVISHRQDVVDMFEQRIMISRDNGISRIEIP